MAVFYSRNDFERYVKRKFNSLGAKDKYVYSFKDNTKLSLVIFKHHFTFVHYTYVKNKQKTVEEYQVISVLTLEGWRNAEDYLRELFKVYEKTYI